MYNHKVTFPTEEQMLDFLNRFVLPQRLISTGHGGDTHTWFEIGYESPGTLSRKSVQMLEQAANLHGGVFYSNWPVRRQRGQEEE